MRRVWMLVLVLAASGLIAAGCGDDDEPVTGGGGATTEESSGGGSSGADPSDPAVQAAVDSCKSSIQAAATLADDVKGDLEKLCEEAASGDPEAVKKASKEVCTKIVEGSVPEGDARTQALAACDAAGG